MNEGRCISWFRKIVWLPPSWFTTENRYKMDSAAITLLKLLNGITGDGFTNYYKIDRKYGMDPEHISLVENYENIVKDLVNKEFVRLEAIAGEYFYRVYITDLGRDYILKIRE